LYAYLTNTIKQNTKYGRKYISLQYIALILPSFVVAKINVPDVAFREQLNTRYAIPFDTENNIANPDSAANLQDIFINFNRQQ
jgi:hypothetical protein